MTADRAHEISTQAQVIEYLDANNNWGRWGADDQRGAANLLTDERRTLVDYFAEQTAQMAVKNKR